MAMALNALSGMTRVCCTSPFTVTTVVASIRPVTLALSTWLESVKAPGRECCLEDVRSVLTQTLGASTFLGHRQASAMPTTSMLSRRSSCL